MDPLQQLFDLYEAEMTQLQDPVSPTVASPNAGEYQHPVIQQRDEVDSHRENGAEAHDAHEMVHGAVDTADVDSKAKLAATLGRVQDGKDKKGVTIDKNSEFKSLMAREDELEKSADQVTPDDLRTPMSQQIPDEQQVDTQEDYDYNLDVAYLQKYGRA